MVLTGQTLAILADDLTGACDTALPLFKQGVTTRIFTSLRSMELTDLDLATEAGVLSVNTHSRHMDPATAQQQLSNWARLLKDQADVDVFYNKVDSTLRGHIAVETLALLDSLDMQTAFIAPALPEEGRQTVGGYHLLNGLPLEQTALARDPLSPVTESYLPDLMIRQLPEGLDASLVGHIPLKTVLEGAGPISVAMKQAVEQGQRLVVVDTATTTDLEQLALAYEKVRKYQAVLMSGSAGLSNALSSLWTSSKADDITASPPYIHLPSRPWVLVSGSNTPLNRLQLKQLLEAYPETRLIEPTARELLGLDPLPSGLQSLEACQSPLIVVSTSLSPQRFEETQSLALEHELTLVEREQRIQDTLAQLLRQANACDAHWLLCGGETAATTLQTLGSARLTMKAEVEPNVPLMQDEHGRWIVTKSGHFGQPNTLTRCIEQLLKWSQAVTTG